MKQSGCRPRSEERKKGSQQNSQPKVIIVAHVGNNRPVEVGGMLAVTLVVVMVSSFSKSHPGLSSYYHTGKL